MPPVCIPEGMRGWAEVAVAATWVLLLERGCSSMPYITVAVVPPRCPAVVPLETADDCGAFPSGASIG